MRSPYRPLNFLRDNFKRSLTYPLSEELKWKSRRHQNKTFIRGTSPGIPYELRDKNAIGWRRWHIATQEWEVCDMESWNRHVCRKGKCTAVGPSRSTGVNLSRKQRCCFPSYLLSQGQRDISDQDYSQNLGYWLTIRHQCICMWSWTEVLTFSFQLREKTV